MRTALVLLTFCVLVAAGCSSVNPVAGGGTDVSNARVAGVVRGNDSVLVPGAIVCLTDENANPLSAEFRQLAADTSDHLGRFSFAGLTPGRYSVYLLSEDRRTVTAIVPAILDMTAATLSLDIRPAIPGTVKLVPPFDVLDTAAFHVFIPGSAWSRGPYRFATDKLALSIDSVPAADPCRLMIQCGKAIFGAEIALRDKHTVEIEAIHFKATNRTADSLSVRLFLIQNRMPLDVNRIANAGSRVTSILLEGFTLDNPSGLSHLACLRSFQMLSGAVTDSVLTELINELSRIDSLRTLRLDWAWRNSVRSIPSSIAALRNLTSLSIKGGSLDTLPDELCYLTQLEVLELQQNAIAELPSGIGRLLSLRRLDLSFNELTTLPAPLFALPKLTDINVWGNRLTTLTAAQIEWLLPRAGDAGIGGQRP